MPTGCWLLPSSYASCCWRSTLQWYAECCDFVCRLRNHITFTQYPGFAAHVSLAPVLAVLPVVDQRVAVHHELAAELGLHCAAAGSAHQERHRAGHLAAALHPLASRGPGHCAVHSGLEFSLKFGMLGQKGLSLVDLCCVICFPQQSIRNTFDQLRLVDISSPVECELKARFTLSTSYSRRFFT